MVDPADFPVRLEAEVDEIKDEDRALEVRPGRVGSRRAEFSAVVGFLGIIGGTNLPVKGSPVMNGCSLAWCGDHLSMGFKFKRP